MRLQNNIYINKRDSFLSSLCVCERERKLCANKDKQNQNENYVKLDEVDKRGSSFKMNVACKHPSIYILFGQLK